MGSGGDMLCGGPDALYERSGPMCYAPRHHLAAIETGPAPQCRLDAEPFDWGLSQALAALDAALMSFGVRAQLDSAARFRYEKMVKAIPRIIQMEMQAGRWTLREAMDNAHRLRNQYLDAIRGRSSDMGRAYAESLKPSGQPLNFYIDKAARRLFPNIPPENLTQTQQSRVFLELIESSGRPNAQVSQLARRLGYVGRGLIVVSLALAVYEVTTAEDKTAAAGRVGVGLSAGFAGSMAGGAAAGLICGPGAPVCVTVGAFVGAVVFAATADWTLSNW